MSAALTAAVASFVVMSGTEDGLGLLRWQARPVLVFSEPFDPQLDKQLELFNADRERMMERDNVIIVDTHADSALRRKFRPDGFTVILIGLDGGEKFRAAELVEPETLNALIDTMPMRQRALAGED
ncbi:MAG: DUF4174 domain-containing protein [Pseudomonadota bacterium]